MLQHGQLGDVNLDESRGLYLAHFAVSNYDREEDRVISVTLPDDQDVSGTMRHQLLVAEGREKAFVDAIGSLRARELRQFGEIRSSSVRGKHEYRRCLNRSSFCLCVDN
jgi:hypothetical protein